MQDQGFSDKDVPSMTGFSKRTMWRRLKDIQFSIEREKYSVVRDQQLLDWSFPWFWKTLDLVSCSVMFWHCSVLTYLILGSVALYGRLQSQHGVLVQRARIESALNIARKATGTTFTRRRLKRRTYYVWAPLSMIHIDGKWSLSSFFFYFWNSL